MLRLALALSTSISFADTVIADADTVYTNALVYTVNKRQPWAEAVAVSDGKIEFVGSAQNVLEFVGDNTEIIDLKGRFLMPGFQDAHIHPLEGASLESFYGCRLEELQKREPNPENWIPYIRACKQLNRPIKWVLGGGHDLADLIDLKRMPKDILDEALPNTPAAFMEKSSHSMWVNSQALRETGVTKSTPDPQGGIIIKDPETGEPNGIMLDSAGDELAHKALAQTPDLQEARYEALLLSQDMMAAEGITSATNARVYWQRGNLLPWLRAEREGTLKQRNIMAIWAYPHMADGLQIPALKKMYRDDKNSRLRLSQVKFYSDGTISNNSAAMLTAYHTLVHPDMKSHGLNYFTEERLTKYITELERVGFDAHIHALGDRAARESLNAIEAARIANEEFDLQPRHQLTHLALIHPDDIPRFGELNVAANFQFNFDIEDYSDQSEDDWWDTMVGETDSLISPAVEIFDTGGKVVLSSDWDVSYMSPLVSIEIFTETYAEGNNKDALIAFAIEAYTLNAAYVMRHDDVTGSIEVGKFADFVILEDNPFEVSVPEIRDIPVYWTLVEGQTIYQAPAE